MEYKDLIELLSKDGINSKGQAKKWLETCSSNELKVLIVSLQEEMILRIIREREVSDNVIE